MIIPHKTFETAEKFQIFIDEEKSWVYARIYEAIHESFNAKKDIAHIMEAKIEDTMSLMTIDSGRDEWLESLELAMVWYVSTENYEKCAKIRDLIESIENTEL